jgi:hypothetical protein
VSSTPSSPSGSSPDEHPPDELLSFGLPATDLPASDLPASDLPASDLPASGGDGPGPGADGRASGPDDRGADGTGPDGDDAGPDGGIRARGPDHAGSGATGSEGAGTSGEAAAGTAQWSDEDVARHVAACETCRGRAADLAAIADLLRSPQLQPGPVPPDVADRIGAALRAEAAAGTRHAEGTRGEVVAAARPLRVAAADGTGAPADAPPARRPLVPATQPAGTDAAAPDDLAARRARRWRVGLLVAAAVAGVAVVVPQVGPELGWQTRGEDSVAGGAAEEAATAPESDAAGPPDVAAVEPDSSAAELARALLAAAEGAAPQAVPGPSDGRATPDGPDGGATPPHAVAEALGGDCGTAAATGLGGQLVGAASYRGDVLVVVQLPAAGVAYLVVPSCGSGPQDALERGTVQP